LKTRIDAAVNARGEPADHGQAQRRHRGRVAEIDVIADPAKLRRLGR